MSSIELTTEDKQTLLQLARECIAYGVDHGTAKTVNPQDYSAELQQQNATFVTLHKHGDLRGCIGTLEAHQPLVADVAEHAYAAAFKDPRFSPVRREELDQLDIDISVLSAPVSMQFSSQQDLLQQLRPGIDGLILEAGYNRGTFLPSVWEQLPEPGDFLKHLKMKAGLPGHWWSDDVKISRYETLSFS